MPQMPKLIFTETHEDPISGEILQEILPELIRLGYEIFFAEIPANKTLPEYIALTSIESMMRDARKNASASFLKFLNKLELEEVDFRGIDLDVIDLGLSAQKWAVSPEGIDARDSQFVQQYIDEVKNVFGFIGFKHAMGMQKKLAELFPETPASDLFHFVHVFKNNSIDSDEEILRSNPQAYPLGMVCLDANILTKEKIIETILEQIKLKQEKTNVLESNCHKPALSKNLFFEQSVSPQYLYNFEELFRLLKRNNMGTPENKKLLLENISHSFDIRNLLAEFTRHVQLTPDLFYMTLENSEYGEQLSEILDILSDHKIVLSNEQYVLLLKQAPKADDIYCDLRSGDITTASEFQEYLDKMISSNLNQGL